jgi:hypothetical protein
MSTDLRTRRTDRWRAASRNNKAPSKSLHTDAAMVLVTEVAGPSRNSWSTGIRCWSQCRAVR